MYTDEGLVYLQYYLLKVFSKEPTFGGLKTCQIIILPGIPRQLINSRYALCILYPMKQFQGLKVRSIKSLRPAEGMGFGSAARIKYITNFTSTNVKFRNLLIFDLYLTVT